MAEFEYEPGMEPEMEAVPRDEASMLSVDVRPGREYVLGGVKNVVRMLAGIRAPEIDTIDASEAAQRPPLQVAIVLDCSGSMGGQPLEFAKRAVLKLIKHLREIDTLHFIKYSSVPQVVFRDGDLSESGKEILKETVGAIQAGGQTNLFGGLESAVELFNATVTEGGAHQDAQVRRIFLFSDGCVNVGVTDKAEIQRKVAEWATHGITVNSFGIGTHFDEPLMRGIAEAGKGKYTYLATAQDIPKLVSKSVHGLLDLFASEAVIDVRGLHHTIVSRIYGADDELETDACPNPANATPGLLALGDLHRGSERRVLVELEVAPPGSVVDGTTFEAAEWTISFQRQGALVQFSGKVPLKATSSRNCLQEECTSVRVAFAIQKAADLDLEISQHLACNNRDRASDAKQRQILLLKETLDGVRCDAHAQTQVDALERVLVRAERVSEQIKRGEDSERVRRQCIQEMEYNRCMSDCDWASGVDSDCGDVANLRDVSSPCSSNSGSPPGSPRCFGARATGKGQKYENMVSPRSQFSSPDDSDSDSLTALPSDSPKPALLLFCPSHDDRLVQRLMPQLEDSFEVTHVSNSDAGIQAVQEQNFQACVAKLGDETGNLGQDVIRELRAHQGQDPFVVVHSDTPTRSSEAQYKLEEEYMVNLFVLSGQEHELIQALSRLVAQ